MRPPLVSRRQSDARVRQLRAAGCKVEKRRVGDEIVVLKSCPPGARVPPLAANPYVFGAGKRPKESVYCAVHKAVGEGYRDLDGIRKRANQIGFGSFTKEEVDAAIERMVYRGDLSADWSRAAALSANPIGTGWLVAGLLGVFGLLWWVGRKKEETSAPCVVDATKLHAWGVANGTGVLYLPNDAAVPEDVAAAEEVLKKVPGGDLDVLALQQDKLVLVTKDGAFWTYDDEGKRKQRNDLRSSYCTQAA